MTDILVIGGGPAGLSAAINAKIRNKDTILISNNRTDSGLYKAEQIDNYPGLPGISGSELSGKMTAHAAGLGIDMITGRVQSIMASGDTFFASYGNEILQASAIILAPGVVRNKTYPGEKELLGRGVSYCATCDGMLYRGKRVCVVCLSSDAEEEAEHLISIGCDVTKLYKGSITINGTDRVHSVTADGTEIECDGVFILRDAISPDTLLPGLNTENGHISTGKDMETNIPSVYAAGDCVGAPYQIAKAVGEGQIAALSAAKYLDKLKTK